MDLLRMECQVSLFVCGHDLDSRKITETLSLAPEVAIRRGDVETLSSGHEVKRKFGVWVYRIEKATDDPAPRLERLISELGDRPQILRGLQGADEGIVEIFPNVLSENGDLKTEFDLNPDSLSALSRYGLPLRIAVYGSPPE